MSSSGDLNIAQGDEENPHYYIDVRDDDNRWEREKKRFNDKTFLCIVLCIAVVFFLLSLFLTMKWNPRD